MAMDAKAFDKSKLPSRVTEGPTRAPHRSYHFAMGLAEEQTDRPIVLMRQVHCAARAVDAAGGTPRAFRSITLTDGSAMGHEGKSSPLWRQATADVIERTLCVHCRDAVFGLAGSDKTCQHEDCLTATGETVKENREGVKFNQNQKVVYSVSCPISSFESAREGAVTHAGGSAEVVCYADI